MTQLNRLCAGLNYSAYRDSPYLFDAAKAYDAVYTLARSLHKLAYDENKSHFSGKELLYNYNHVGVTGNTSLSSEFKDINFDLGNIYWYEVSCGELSSRLIVGSWQCVSGVSEDYQLDNTERICN